MPTDATAIDAFLDREAAGAGLTTEATYGTDRELRQGCVLGSGAVGRAHV